MGEAALLIALHFELQKEYKIKWSILEANTDCYYYYQIEYFMYVQPQEISYVNCIECVAFRESHAFI